MPEDVLQAMVEKSFCFGLYEITTGPRAGTTAGNGNGNGSDSISAETGLCQIGFARLVGDMVTFVYVTDLYVLQEYQGRGVGGWLIDCIGEMVEGMPWLRWAMLRTSMEKSQKAYEKRLGMGVLRSGDVREGPVMMGRKGGCGGGLKGMAMNLENTWEMERVTVRSGNGRLM
ncbi:hypothetical protein N7539_006823 [Penicillium diatomitis]|uniref:N-acetyltransferase domain-containing protein n=1 Tax=Penicillium diatomitis TaxID=2819901 RepID=A0A9W9X209_9EURO|nr:uncharacterized protein N7539_006823 [Penicillium diatomitis]KAJ5480929.1 hypothetical protein N7539_006823 [Penicillium diatomitis]